MNQNTKKAKTRRRANSPGSIFDPLEETGMAAIDRELHALLIAAGYTVGKRELFTGIKLNGFKDIHHLEYRRDGYGVFITTQHPAPDGVVTA